MREVARVLPIIIMVLIGFALYRDLVPKVLAVVKPENRNCEDFADYYSGVKTPTTIRATDVYFCLGYDADKMGL